MKEAISSENQLREFIESTPITDAEASEGWCGDVVLAPLELTNRFEVERRELAEVLSNIAAFGQLPAPSTGDVLYKRVVDGAEVTLRHSDCVKALEMVKKIWDGIRL